MNTPFGRGESWLFCMTNGECVGRVKEARGKFLILDDASWLVGDEEFKSVGRCVVNTDLIINASPWATDALPTEQI